MPAVSECLNRRYNAVDSLMKELNLSVTRHNSLIEPSNDTNNVGIKLMCDFWNMLKDDPDCNLTKVAQQHSIRSESRNSIRHVTYRNQRFITCMAEPEKKSCCINSTPSSTSSRGQDSMKAPCCSAKDNRSNSDELPLSKVLCNLKEAASFDQKCHVKVKELMAAQAQLKEQIQILEDKEKDGVALLKEADSMWLCMEDCYKRKVAQTIDSQNVLIAQIKEIDESMSKWRKNKKELQYQMENMEKVKREINDDINQKKNDLKIIEVEVTNLKKRVDSNAIDLENTKKSSCSKKDASNARMSSISNQISKMQRRTYDQLNHKKLKEEEGAQYVKEARQDLQKICKVLITKKLENEDLRAEKKGILEELMLLNKTADSCKEKCKNKEDNLKTEIVKLTGEITNFKAKCLRCHVCTDTDDARKLCTDCPRCATERDCLFDGGEYCTSDSTMDCVCMSVKQKFLDNVFENMYTVLEGQSKTYPGKAVADQVLNCLKNSRNGKLTADTRKILQDFILTTVKKNLNLTIIGGAVKTRCEMDPDTYKQLMLCLNQITPTKPDNKDKGTDAKKPPCTHWGGTNECQCPKGPKACICTKKAPPPVGSSKPCPQNKDDVGPAKTCPEKSPKVCGPDCGMQGKPSATQRAASTDVAQWRPDPCSGPSCTFSQNMRAAQCVLGPESLQPTLQYSSAFLPNKSTATKVEASCTCGSKSETPCPIHLDCRYQPRQRIIEEVMGGYNQIAFISDNNKADLHSSSP